MLVSSLHSEYYSLAFLSNIRIPIVTDISPTDQISMVFEIFEKAVRDMKKQYLIDEACIQFSE